jgi:ABC-type transport system involved in multi-copper enzyme maturation permease subunit
MNAYESAMPDGRDGFGQLLRAEWTKFRTVRGWVIGAGLCGVLLVLFGLLVAAGTHTSVKDSASGAEHTPTQAEIPPVPRGPGGEAVNDNFYFVHQSLAGNGTVTARVTSLTAVGLGQVGMGGDGNGGNGNGAADSSSGDGLQPWTKAGLIVKANTTQGSAYAAAMVTGGHGVRMQYNYTGDIAGPVGAVSSSSPRWLRLTRTGDTVTGYSSTDGNTWTTLGTVRLAGLPSTVQIGLFVASPGAQQFDEHFGGTGSSGYPTLATAVFDNVSGSTVDSGWQGLGVGDNNQSPDRMPGYTQSGGTFTLNGSGDIGPNVDGAGQGIERTLIGAFAALTVVAVFGVLFITSEYRRGLIRTTFAASPRRGRVLAAKSVVVGAVTFVAGLVGATIAVPLTSWLLRHNGNRTWPAPWQTDLRIIAGTAALLAVAAVLAVGIGAILRRSAGAVTAVVVLMVLPYILSVSAVLPAAPAQWLLRLTPAAAFAVQQSVQAYAQVNQRYTPPFGFFPLAPWAGFAVLCAWAALALGVAMYRLNRRDA